MWEWNEEIVPFARGLRGGSWNFYARGLAASHWSSDYPTVEDFPNVGIRVARLVPEPAHALLVLTGGVLLAAARRQRRAWASQLM